jgi:hypothetical protein
MHDRWVLEELLYLGELQERRLLSSSGGGLADPWQLKQRQLIQYRRGSVA